MNNYIEYIRNETGKVLETLHNIKANDKGIVKLRNKYDVLVEIKYAFEEIEEVENKMKMSSLGQLVEVQLSRDYLTGFYDGVKAVK